MGKIKSRFDTDTDRYRLLKIPKKYRIPIPTENIDTDPALIQSASTSTSPLNIFSTVMQRLGYDVTALHAQRRVQSY